MDQVSYRLMLAATSLLQGHFVLKIISQRA